MKVMQIVRVKPTKKWKQVKLAGQETLTVTAVSRSVYIAIQEPFEDNKILLQDHHAIDFMSNNLWIRKADNDKGWTEVCRWEHDEE